MTSLCLHRGSREVPVELVHSTPTPAADGAHHPIAHGLVLDIVRNRIGAQGLAIMKEQHALSPDGARYFGCLELDMRSDDGSMAYSVGVRNTHDRSYAAALVLGTRVFVCDNLAFSGEVLLGRKHTRHIERDLPELVNTGFRALRAERIRHEDRILAYRSADLTNKDAHDLIVRAIGYDKVVPPTQFLAVLNAWNTPEFPEFEPRTVWSLVNAFTQVVRDKSRSLPTTVLRSQKIHDSMDRALGLHLPTRESILAEAAGDDVEVR